MASRKKVKRGGASRLLPAAEQSGSATNSQVPARRIRGKRGGLKDMPTLPVDVLLEIFAHMHPRDLLNMSRTSRDFRSFLMNRANAGLWRAARSNEPGLPECPPFLSEPAYANVVFSSLCHVCLKNVPHHTRVFIEFGARYCTKCGDSMLVDRDQDEELDDFLQELEEFINDDGEKDEVELPLLFTHYYPSRLLRSQIAEFRARWDANSDDEARNKLIEEEAGRKKEIEAWSNEFYAWIDGKSSARSAELAKLRRGRVDAIMDRLRQEGWQEEMALPDNKERLKSLAKQKFANKPAALTDKVWKNIRGEANKWVETVRAQRLHDHRRRVLDERFNVFADFIKRWTDDHWPSEDDQEEPIPLEGIKLGDWLVMPEIQTLLDYFDEKVQLTDAILDKALQDGSFNPVDLAYVWYRDRRVSLIGILKRSLGLPELDEDDDPLELAIHSFDCVYCDEKFMKFPEVLMHRCRWSWKKSKYAQYCLDYRAIAQAYTCDWSLQIKCWSPDLVRINPRVFPDKARALVQTMGLNPAAATHEAMNKCKTRLTCADCGRKPDGKYEVFDWKRALFHQDSEAHFGDLQPCNWVVLPEEVAERVRDHEAAMKQAGNSRYFRTVSYYRCDVRRCRWSVKFYYYEREELFAHMHREHGISEAEVDDDKLYIELEAHAVKDPPYVYFSHSTSGDIVVSQ